MVRCQVSIETFVSTRRAELITLLERYCASDTNHDEASDFAWSVIDGWEEGEHNTKSPYLLGERTFWAAIWSLQHLADEQYWEDGVTQRELRRYIPLLKENSELPQGEDGRRP